LGTGEGKIARKDRRRGVIIRERKSWDEGESQRSKSRGEEGSAAPKKKPERRFFTKKGTRSEAKRPSEGNHIKKRGDRERDPRLGDDIAGEKAKKRMNARVELR